MLLRRNRREYGYQWRDDDVGHRSWVYADGGVFDNEPLRMAIDLAGQLDRARPLKGDEQRVYVVIDPNLNAPAVASPNDGGFDFDWPEIEEGEHGSLHGTARVLLQLLRVVAGQATFKDWLKVGKLNNRVRWQELFIKRFAHILEALDGQDGFEPEAMAVSIRDQLKEIIRTKYEATSGQEPTDDEVDAYLSAQLERLSQRYTRFEASLSDDMFELLMAMLALLENASGLRKKQELKMIGIAPTQTNELAGAFLGGFGGFFDEDIRVADFAQGVARAEAVLDASFLPLELAPQEEPAADLPRSYRDLPHATRRRFRSYLMELTLAQLLPRESLLGRLLGVFDG